MYAKLFNSLYQGTLRGQPHEILVFTNLLAHCDREGCVDKHWRAISDEVGLSEDQVRAAILNLEKADPESRSADSDGRRITRLDEHRAWGWHVTNYGKYLAIRNEDDRREQNRVAQAKFRAKKAIVAPGIPGSLPAKRVDLEHKPEPIEMPPALKAPVVKRAAAAKPEEPGIFDVTPFAHFWNAYPKSRRRNRGRAEAAWNKWKLDDTLPDILKALAWQVRSTDWKKEAGQFIPHPASYLNAKAWMDEPEMIPGKAPVKRDEPPVWLPTLNLLVKALDVEPCDEEEVQRLCALLPTSAILMLDFEHKNTVNRIMRRRTPAS